MGGGVGLSRGIVLGCLLVGVLGLPRHVVGQDKPQPAKPSQQTQAQQQPHVVFDTSIFRALFDEAAQKIAEEKATNKDAEDRKERREEADLDAQKAQARWAFWMFIAAAAQLPLSAVTLGFLWRTLFHTRRTADAGIKAANAAVESEAPMLYASRIVLRQTGQNATLGAGMPDHTYEIVAEFKNCGRTSAVVTETCINFMVDKAPPATPTYTNARPQGIGTLIHPDASQPPSSPFELVQRLSNLTPQQQADLNGGADLWAYGYVLFEDFMDIKREFGFISKWNPGNRPRDPRVGFLEEGPPDYRYRRKRKAQA